MRQRRTDPPGGWLLDGRRYATEAEYLQAWAKREARRDRLQARLDAEADYLRGVRVSVRGSV